MILQQIESALQAVPDTSNFTQAAERLLDVLDYASTRTIQPFCDVDEFIQTFPAPNPNTQTEQDFISDAESIQVLFQITDEEIQATAQPILMDSHGGFDIGKAKSFIFVAVELKDDTYPRGKYVQFTREINKRFASPTVVLFKTNHTNLVTLAFVHRRPNKIRSERDVLGNVSLIKEIDTVNPHRAHRDVLTELSLNNILKWMHDHDTAVNFDGLLAAWLAKLDTEELNRRFYKALFAWFEKAVKCAKFPDAKSITPEEHVIRLITRLLFIWFIKEKRLISEELFIEEQIKRLLKDYDSDTGDSYYRAVLQNLFFATLNTEIRNRGFSSKTNSHHRNFSKYRYKDHIADPGALIRLFAKTPFINGGLFDCLDSEEATSNNGYRIDCFSDNPSHYKQLSIPNRLFFHKLTGLIPLFNRYKFTVEENTPAEQEVALDPELLGKVFENLLAAINPETKQSARKQTGSYYTPRPVVDYMVEESLIATLAQNSKSSDGDSEFLQERIRYLLDYSDAYEDGAELFDEREKDDLVRAIAQIKTLDPAVGSGAFPMGILHKLTLGLRRLDPRNYRWERLQKEIAQNRASAAFDTQDQAERDEELRQISETFERYRSSDFGRKLYLIQNSIFGVDIQPVATQIAKLRFFISLAIEQDANNNPNQNYGIKPLPNLETRFVAANTLIGLGNQAVLGNGDRTRIEHQIRENRERHFHASTRQKKNLYRHRDKELRNALSHELQKLGMPAGEADKISLWDPYDQNASADWFDPQYMFGVRRGFDLVIGNPPYVRSEAGDRNRELRAQIIASQEYETLYEKWDLYIPFIERSYRILKEDGFTSLIVSDSYCHARYARKSQDWFLNNSRIIHLDFLGKIRIFEASVHNIIFLFQKSGGKTNKPKRNVHYPEFGTVTQLQTDEQRNLTHRAFFPEDVISQTFPSPTIALEDICYISYGLRPSSKKDARDKFVTADVTAHKQDELHPRAFVEGKHLDYWLPARNIWIEWGTDRAPSEFYTPTFPELYEVDEKIIVQKNPGPDPKSSYDNNQLVFSSSTVGIVPWHMLSGVRNNSIKKQARYHCETPARPDLPAREKLEDNSRRFSIKFLLGVLNSSVACDFLRANRRHNVSLYPNDWKKVAIPDVSPEQQTPVVDLVNRILKAKDANPSADTSGLESQIDQLVYQLYGLTPEEIAVVERPA